MLKKICPLPDPTHQVLNPLGLKLLTIIGKYSGRESRSGRRNNLLLCFFKKKGKKLALTEKTIYIAKIKGFAKIKDLRMGN